MKRSELIQLCQDAVVHHTKWQDRDSYSAQKSIQSIYRGLTAGLDFRIVTKDIDEHYHSGERNLIVEFIQPIDHTKLREGQHLKISEREDYFRDCDPNYETEMFDGCGIDFSSDYTQTYMPTQKRLDECSGGDWY